MESGTQHVGALVTRRAIDPADRARCLEIRRVVFIEEQGVPKPLEIDQYEDQSEHLLAEVGGEPAGCLRLRSAYGVVKIERVATLAAYRKRGVASALMEAAETLAGERWPRTLLYLHAQDSVISFYQHRGYIPFGDRFMDAGIGHRAMAKLAPTAGKRFTLSRLRQGSAPAEAQRIVRESLAEYKLPAEGYDHDLKALERVYADGAFYVVRLGKRSDGPIVGTAAWRPLPLADGGDPTQPVAEVRRLFLTQGVRGQGIGRQLLHLLELDASHSGMRHAVLETASALIEAVRLFTRYGYQNEGPEIDTERCDHLLGRDLGPPPGVPEQGSPAATGRMP
jgi:predicted GNAT family N-acyltransferase